MRLQIVASNKNKMNSTTKTIVWGVAIAAAGVGIYFGVNALLNRNSLDGDRIEDPSSGEAPTRPTPTNPKPKKRKIDSQRIVRKGMSDPAESAEIEYIQTIANLMRSAARKVRWESQIMKTYPTGTQNWIKSLAAMPSLKVDGNFGSNTEKAVFAVTGKSQTHLCKFRGQRRSLAQQMKKADPYAKYGTICGNY